MTADKGDKDSARFSLASSSSLAELSCAELFNANRAKKFSRGNPKKPFLAQMRAHLHVAHAEEDKEDEVEGVGHQGRIANARVS